MAKTAEKNKRKKTNSRPVGRPKKFESLEELQKMIDDYFESCYEEVWEETFDEKGKPNGWKPLLDRQGNIVKRQVKPFTVTGLATALGTTRRTLIDYEERNDEFSHTIKMAKQKCEEFAEEQLFTNKNTAGVIFNMVNNYGWKNKQEHDQNVNVKGKLEDFFA